ncbi:MAG: DUF1801 domain-containing protein [Spirochaetes bacterium]|nr:DUF1801 domain-containing protein [Spirochaetota bacterium]
MKKGFETIDAYCAQFPPEVRKILQNLRSVIRKAAPDAVEKISYQMPAFTLNGVLVYFAAYKNHIGFYPTGNGIRAFQKELSSFETSKGTIRFPIDKPLPIALIKKIVKYRVKENAEKAVLKTRKK